MPNFLASRSGTRASPWLVLLVAALALAGSVSAVAGVYFSITRSQDFQWSPERLLLRHIDPWQVALAGNPGNLLMGTQNPNYLQELYVLLVPFGLLPLHAANLAWGLCNLGFAIASALLAARFYGLRGRLWAIGITGTMLAAAPTRTSISNGQQGLAVLALWAFALLATPTKLGARTPTLRDLLLIGVSYLKYSFAPAMVLYLLLRDGVRRGVRRLPLTFLPPAVGTLLVWLWLRPPHTPASLLRQAVEPLAVAKAGYQPTGDPAQTLMDLMEYLLGGAPVATPRLTLLCFAVAVTLTAAVLLCAIRWLHKTGLSKTADGFGWLLALTATMSFALYKHHPYDEVVFLFPLCHALRHLRRWTALATLVLIADHWFVQRFLDAAIVWSFTWAELRLASFLLIVACVYATKPDRQADAGTDAQTSPVLEGTVPA